MRLVPKVSEMAVAGDWNSDLRFEKYLVSGIAKEREPLAKALDAHNRACLPADAKSLAAALARLRLTTAHTQQRNDIEALIAIYADILRQYPGDVAMYVLKTQPKFSKFWPTESELVERLDRWSKKRFSARDALQRALIKFDETQMETVNAETQTDQD
jgi:hypothetical protein